MATRIESIDLLRGAVMLIMAIDHCRDHLLKDHPDPTDLATTTPLLFFTRWITHFCAPVFVFLSGISAWLAGTRRTQRQLSSLLMKRGLWLVAVEILVIAPGLTLDPLYHFVVLQVIWTIGGSMLLLGLLIRLGVSRLMIGVIGAMIFLGHNIFDYTGAGALGKTFVWHLLMSASGFGTSNMVKVFPHHYAWVIYALLPWTGVMLLGYAVAPMYGSGFDAARRRRLLMRTGLWALLGFLVLRGFNLYGDPAPWSVQKTSGLTVLSFLNVTKYPCSLMYLLMTLGPALIILAVTEGVRNRFVSAIVVYGNVPFFYYVIHWYLIGLCTIVVFILQGYGAGQIVTPDDPLFFDPPGFGLSLAGMYAVWLVVVVLMYGPCRWFSGYKRRNSKWWLSYV
ncbi:MAG TPA: heparan-alpha-glucosaminide N-acetyltransferase domain-containing protein [Puia sp.]|jgi:uncharacterized membrane protein|nr:heparan-alpha-glucosaminide N-acetyltransferase domain-containing protein [Puia sp.]